MQQDGQEHKADEAQLSNQGRQAGNSLLPPLELKINCIFAPDAFPGYDHEEKFDLAFGKYYPEEEMPRDAGKFTYMLRGDAATQDRVDREYLHDRGSFFPRPSVVPYKQPREHLRHLVPAVCCSTITFASFPTYEKPKTVYNGDQAYWSYFGGEAFTWARIIEKTSSLLRLDEAHGIEPSCDWEDDGTGTFFINLGMYAQSDVMDVVGEFMGSRLCQYIGFLSNFSHSAFNSCCAVPEDSPFGHRLSRWRLEWDLVAFMGRHATFLEILHYKSIAYELRHIADVRDITMAIRKRPRSLGQMTDSEFHQRLAPVHRKQLRAWVHISNFLLRPEEHCVEWWKAQASYDIDLAKDMHSLERPESMYMFESVVMPQLCEFVDRNRMIRTAKLRASYFAGCDCVELPAAKVAFAEVVNYQDRIV